ncbi:DNA cytosine methyltransferase [Laceyella putida]|uniref:DNA (cytosine-5-)-methyltransferase n=1 Tax=Laceyella putida TaxID=110101 RepID=A0ABW2RQS5_9BACL
MKFKALHLFAGIGGGALGFQQAREEWKGAVGTIETMAGIDCDAEACADFEMITGAPAIQMDLFSRQQYIDFHGHEPPDDWEEVTPFSLWQAVGGEYPDIVFTSAPCKSFSGLLGQDKAKTKKYQALSQLTIRGIQLTLKAFEEDLPSLILFENVPRIATRGKHLLDEIKRLLKKYGYAVSDGYHDCGEIGALAQHRKRYLLIARNEKKVPAFVYHPPVKKMKTVGDVLKSLPLPDSLTGGKMHRLPKLQFKTWLRLALIRPGKDWRDLERNFSQYCLVADGKETDIPEVATGFKDGTHGTIYKVSRWDEAANTVTGAFRPNNGAICIADPRLGCKPRSGTYGILRWDQVANTVTGSADVHAGTCAVADPRIPEMNEKGQWVIISEEGNWHRPLTTLELAALQGFPVQINGNPLELAGNSEARWRERIGNAVPPQASRAIAETMLRTLMPARENEWIMSAEEVWVQPSDETKNPLQCH